jgi:hypothetical protein
MARTFIARKIILTDTPTALSATPLVGDITLSFPPSNTGTASIYDPTDVALENPVPVITGECLIDLDDVDLTKIKVKGTPGDIATIIGTTW